MVDVGAQTGRHTVPLAKLVGPRGMVHAFEPIPSIRLQLAGRLASEAIHNTVLYPFALSSSDQEVEFHYIPAAPEESGIKARQTYNSAEMTPELIKLQVKKFDDLFSTPFDFIKIDIEGDELDMLAGASRNIERSRPVVAFECGANAFLTYHDRPEEIFDFFEKRGFEVWSIMGDRIEDAASFRAASHAQQFWDYIALPYEKRGYASCLRS